ncbi:pyridoxamine 5'-phosphate oxidase family protein [Nesterenkonia ebinurensis]|uniref:pyridoxamine 5'-phosphate oxidase family protein n=1 Tax=Nesterenkonia ebinurensis TaxID=2608252 RepID=UPI00123DAEA4|nr:pyridoxamine 5'-phosphate oxidase family protein [Nesterenkonia ebinurensis]
MQNTPSTPTTEVLQSRDCWDLLRSVSLGRLAVWTGDHPEIFPLTYLTDQKTIIFRTGPGTKLSAVLGDTPVALEADEIDTRTNIAWSVVVKGRAQQMEHTEEFLTGNAHRLIAWEAGTKDYFIRITPEVVTGRRFLVAGPHAWEASLDDASRSGLE